jgi:chromosome segregation ATPase
MKIDGRKKNQKRRTRAIRSLDQGRTNVKEIAQELSRTPTAIRNLRHKKKLVIKAKNEITILQQKINELHFTISLLQTHKDSLTREVDGLKKEVDSLKKDKEKLEVTLKPKLTDWSLEISKLFQPKNP